MLAKWSKRAGAPLRKALPERAPDTELDRLSVGALGFESPAFRVPW
jgi:hypothetical protein